MIPYKGDLLFLAGGAFFVAAMCLYYLLFGGSPL